ncbi:MAG TPA: hypothetical protein VK452_03030 [Dissulfurispiraceae bacterium]|nr:hypothetical protein [Dissulfurispiraceae bacterium]
MEEINELINRYHLQEDNEYVIIPFVGADGRKKRCFLLKRRFIRIVFPEGHFVDYPLTDAIEATIKYPDLRLSEAIYQLHKENSAIASPDAFSNSETEPDTEVD